MAHMFADGEPLLSKRASVGEKTVYGWNVAKIVLLHSRRDEFALKAAADSEDHTGIDDTIIQEFGVDDGEMDYSGIDDDADFDAPGIGGI